MSEQLNNFNHEPQPELSLEQALWRVREDQMLQFTDSGFRLFDYVETGEIQGHSMNVGGSEHVVRIPVKEPVLRKDTSSINELFDPYDEYLYDDGSISDKIDSVEYEVWLESLVKPQDVKEAAVKQIAKRTVEGDSQTIPCTNCEGDARSVDCPCCEGSGKAAKYYQIVLNNEMTGETRVLKLDLADLIANDEIDVEWSGYERVDPDDQISQKRIIFNVSDYIDRNIAEMGVDKDNAAVVNGDSLAKIESEKANVVAGRASWRNHEGKINSGFTHGQFTDNRQDDLTADDVLNHGQTNLSRTYSWPYGKLKNSEGVVIGEEWTMRPLRSMEQTLEDTKTVMAEHGYTLGFTQSFIATGETGPSFYLLDQNANVVDQLSSEYDIREALENAWLNFQKLQENS